MKMGEIIIGGIILLLILSNTVTAGKYDYIQRVDKPTIITNKIFRDTPIGLAIWSSNTIVINCLFINCTDEGIIICNSVNNLIMFNYFIDCVDGIELQISGYNKILFNKFWDIEHMGIDAIHQSNNYNLIAFNEFRNAPYGIYFKESYNNTIIANRFENIWTEEIFFYP
jgi:parallel beta-helix repeat protein